MIKKKACNVMLTLQAFVFPICARAIKNNGQARIVRRSSSLGLFLRRTT